MADAGIKQIRIAKSSLPPINGNKLTYDFRYRIITEDKNRTSHWSPIYSADMQPVISTTGAISVATNIITVVWGDENGHPLYDVFVSFDGGLFFYHGTPSVHSYSFLKTGTSTVQVKVQLISYNKEINEDLVIFDSGIESLV